jgi:D-2-hydroxyglutarate dehydrogenase
MIRNSLSNSNNKRYLVINVLRRLATRIEKRNERYATVSDRDLSFFERALGKSDCVTDTNILDSHNTDWLRTCKGQSKLVLYPTNTQQICTILSYCNEKMLAVCAQGGNTGLVGGSVPVYDEIILSTRLMNRITRLNTDSNIITCESGCVLQTLDEYLSKYGLMMPLDLGAKGSCHIGGNVSTNAGGLRLLRYGSLKGNVLGLEAVLANGDIIDSTKTALRKDNTGYDLGQLFIGSEGTLGFVTGVSILCPVKPNTVNVLLVACNGDFDVVLNVFKLAKRELNEILSAFEFFDKESMKTVNENLKLENPFSSSMSASQLDKCKFYCLIETHGSCEQHDRSKLEIYFNKLIDAKLCSEAVLAENKAQFAQIWELRERLAEALTKDGYNYKYDISLPLNRMYDLVIELRKRLDQLQSSNRYKRCIGYGHLGDGNLHLNITSPKYNELLFDQLEPYIFEWTRQNSGSISAEHGLGLKKRNYIYYSKSAEMVNQMKRIKYLFDPNRILNPYKTLPEF